VLTLADDTAEKSPKHPVILTWSWFSTRGNVTTSNAIWIENKIKLGIFDEKRGSAALLIKNSGFDFVRNPM